DDLVTPFDVLVRGDRREEVARTGEAVRADRSELGQTEHRTVVLADVAARRALRQLGAEAHPAREERDLAGRDREAAELGEELERPRLRNDQQLAVRVVEDAVLHVAVRGVP